MRSRNAALKEPRAASASDTSLFGPCSSSTIPASGNHPRTSPSTMERTLPPIIGTLLYGAIPLAAGMLIGFFLTRSRGGR